MTLFHEFGTVVRELLLAIPMPMARALFVLMPLALLIWVLLLPREQTVPIDSSHPRRDNLKWAAGLALALQVLIYLIGSF